MLVMLLVGVGTGWAETYTITFKTNSSDGSTTIAANTQVSNVVSAGASYVSGFTSSCSKAYLACVNGVKLGSSNATGTLEFNIATNYQSNIKKITVKSAKYGSDTGNLTLYSGSTSLKTGITPGTDYTHTFTTATTVSSIKISTSAKRAYISEIVLETGSSEPVNASWSVEPASVSVKASKTATATITTNYDGTLSVSSANSSIATATINGKVITVTGVAGGNTTLNVTGAVTSSYNAINKTIDVTVTANARPENEIFYESFDTNNGTGGNDNQWSGSIASNNIKQDNDGWVYENASGANECAKFGAGSKLGSATTPALGQACNATLTFKAAAWNGNSESTTLKLSVIDGGSVSPATVTMNKGAWKDFEVTLTNLTASSKIKFEGNAASNSRFFLDEVSIVKTSGSIPTVTVPSFSPAAGTYTGAQTITLTQNEASMIMYTTDGTDPSYENEVGETYDAPFQISSSCTVKAIAIDDDGNESEVASAEYVIKKDPTNTQATAYTVAQAKEIIDDSEYDLTKEVYVKGTVSEIVTAWSDQYENITYNISDDGETTSQQFQLYRCATNGAEVGDDVVAYGTLTKYNSTYEFAEGNTIVKRDKVATLSIADITVANGEDITPVITTNIVGEYAIEYTSDNEEVVLADDDELVTMGAGTATITATLVADGYKTAETTFNVTVTTGATVSSVTLSGELTNTTYTIGDTFDHTGLVATANYSDDTHVNVTETATWEVDPETFTTAGSVTVTVSASFGGQEDIQEYEVTVNKKEANISFASATLDVEVGKNITLEPTTTPADAEISYTITEGDSYVSLENGVVTGVAEGTATIRADFAGNGEYDAASTTVTINVIPAVTKVTFDLSKDETNTATESELSWVTTEVTMLAEKGTSGTNTNNYYPGTEGKTYTSTRFYKNSTLTITPAAGITITSVEYTAANHNYATELNNSAWTNATANMEEGDAVTLVTITPTNGAQAISATIGNTTGATSVVVYYTGEAAPALSSIALSGTYPTVFNKGDEFSHEGMTVTAKYTDGSDEDVTSSATFSGYDMNTLGEQTVTVSYTEGEITKTAQYNITVNKAPFVPTPAAAGYEVVDFKNVVYSSLTGNDQEQIDEYEGTSFAMAFAKPDGQNTYYTKYFANGAAVRTYTGNTITITGAEAITNVDIAWVTGYVDDAVSITGLGNATAVVTFSKNCRFTAITVGYKKFDLTVTNAGYATLCLPFNATVPVGATVYTGKYNNGSVTLNEVEGGKIKAGEGYIVANEGSHTFYITSDEVETPANNNLKGVTERTQLTADGSIYIFANQDQGVGFYILGKDAYLGANKAYLKIPDGGSAREFVGFGDETAINAIDAMPMTDGKYLKDGKIIIVKNGMKYNVNGQRMR